MMSCVIKLVLMLPWCQWRVSGSEWWGRGGDVLVWRGERGVECASGGVEDDRCVKVCARGGGGRGGDEWVIGREQGRGGGVQREGREEGGW